LHLQMNLVLTYPQIHMCYYIYKKKTLFANAHDVLHMTYCNPTYAHDVLHPTSNVKIHSNINWWINFKHMCIVSFSIFVFNLPSTQWRRLCFHDKALKGFESIFLCTMLKVVTFKIRIWTKNIYIFILPCIHLNVKYKVYNHEVTN